ncbi:MAG TPA: hypothetical protein VIZ28_20360 [Chitinophagaceae bacterium]
MKKRLAKFRDIVIAGLLFLLPLLVLFIVLVKVFQGLKTITSRIAAYFGLNSVLGVPGSSIVGVVGFILLCLICGYLVRIAFFKQIRNWLDQKLRDIIPGYAVYYKMAASKLDDKEEALPYEAAAWIHTGEGEQPGFIMERMPDGKLVVFLPTAGKAGEGSIIVMDASKAKICTDADMRGFKLAINNLGIGLSKFAIK